MSLLREQGIEHLDRVKLACMEGDGHLSVVTGDGSPRPVAADSVQILF
jgi:uncharacterized membrane protein YcaP (DUF421 family)